MSVTTKELGLEQLEKQDLGNKSNGKECLQVHEVGRWSADEHEGFIECLKQYGKNWKKIEEMIPTRNSVQIRSHAQKFFNKLIRQFKKNPEKIIESKLFQILQIHVNSELQSPKYQQMGLKDISNQQSFEQQGY